MYSDLYDFLELAADNGQRVEVNTVDEDVFTGISAYQDEGYDDGIGWSFADVKGVSYGILHFSDIDKVRLEGETEWAWERNQLDPPDLSVRQAGGRAGEQPKLTPQTHQELQPA
ncbi:MAG: hypothetical protein FWG65_09695 [Turicibacter sp.]|nr:hypothetical protein [Turicibacter sp.]